MDNLFIDRKKGHKKLLMVLSGYKPDLWDTVFDRLYKYISGDIDVCIVTSGLKNERLIEIAKEHDWSYFATDINNLCLAQNECIALFPNVDYIFKMDEDMFVTKKCFSKLYFDLKMAEEVSPFVPSCIVPTINVNCTTYRDVLIQSSLNDNFRLLREFEQRFGKAKITNGLHHNQHILEDPEVAKFMWSRVDIDENYAFGRRRTSICGTRFSIGLILFTRKMWEMMGGFTVELDAKEDYKKKGLGTDEKDICTFAMLKAMPMLIDNRVLVGHLGYGPQSKDMLEFFKENQQYFRCKD